MRSEVLLEKTALSDKRLLSEKESCFYWGLSRYSIRRLAENVGAIRHFGRRILYDRIVLDTYFDNQN